MTSVLSSTPVIDVAGRLLALLRVDEALGAARRNGGNRITMNEAELRDITAMV